MKKSLPIALIISGHLGNSKRKGSIHFIAQSLAELGYQPHFLTVGLSPISQFKSDDQRVHQLNKTPQNQWFPIGQNQQGFVWFSLFHPFNLKNRWLNLIATPLFSLYPHLFPQATRHVAQKANLIIIESGLGILLAPMLKKLNPNATYIYTASDRLSTLNAHPILETTLQKHLKTFHLIRVPAQAMLPDFPNAKTIYIPHGINKALFNQKHPTPYKTKLNAISIGNMLYDEFTISTLAQAMPNVTFHLFGKGVGTQKPSPNVIAHGEKPFAQLVPYLQHASFGIAPYKMSASADYLSQSSLKMTQYTYCQLPIVAPIFAASGRPHVCSYQPNNATSIILAGKQALKYPHAKIKKDHTLTWPEITQLILKHAGVRK